MHYTVLFIAKHFTNQDVPNLCIVCLSILTEMLVYRSLIT